jgi:hypothetical protein
MLLWILIGGLVWLAASSLFLLALVFAARRKLPPVAEEMPDPIPVRGLEPNEPRRPVLKEPAVSVSAVSLIEEPAGAK